MTTGDRIKQARKAAGLTQTELANKIGVKFSTIHKYESGMIVNLKRETIAALADALDVKPSWLMCMDETVPSESDIPKDFIQLFAGKQPDNVIPFPAIRTVPLVGTIACGDPILAEENIEGRVTVPDNIHADFALRCKGDSMINARIFDGDLVYIRQQETVDDGEIAAVLINDEATLKRVHLYGDHISLEPENPQYRPIVIWGVDMNTVRILGKAVAFTGIVR